MSNTVPSNKKSFECSCRSNHDHERRWVDIHDRITLYSFYSESGRSIPPMSSTFKKETNRHWILFSLHKEIIGHSHSLWFPRNGTPIVILHTPPPNGSNIRKGRKQITKQYSNSHPIMKIYFQIIFEFSQCATFAFTVTNVPLSCLYFDIVFVQNSRKHVRKFLVQSCFSETFPPKVVDNESPNKDSSLNLNIQYICTLIPRYLEFYFNLLHSIS